MLEGGSATDFKGRVYSNNEMLLPKYEVSAGRDDFGASTSIARLYITKGKEERKSLLFKALPGTNLGLFSDSPYVGFLLTSATESRSEKVQTQPLHGDNYTTVFYGENPRTYSYSGVLYNLKTARWRDLFDILYENVFRGSKVSETGSLVQLMYDDRVVTGWMTGLSQSIEAVNETVGQFSFNLLVRRSDIITPIDKLSEHKAFFIGSMSPSEKNYDGLTPVALDSTYTRKARIRLPPKPKITSAGRATCKVQSGFVARSGELKKVKAENTQGSTASASPTRGSCDVAEAIVQQRRRYERAAAKVKSLVGKKSKTAETARAAALTTQNDARHQLLGAYQQVTEGDARLTPEERKRGQRVLTGITEEELIAHDNNKVKSSALRRALRAKATG